MKSAIKQHSTYEIIDKSSVRLVETHDMYWVRLPNLGLDFINIDENDGRTHDPPLMGRSWPESPLGSDHPFSSHDANLST